MAGRRTSILKTWALVLNTAGVYFFLSWFSRTDFAFGHSEGPPQEVLTTASVSSDLVSALADEDEAVRTSAAQAIEKIGPEAAPALAVGLESPNADVRKKAGELLRAIGPEAAVVLHRRLDEGDAQERRRAIAALAEMGAKAEAAFSRIVLALRDDDETVREAAQQAIRRLEVTILPTLRKMLADPDAARRLDAVRGLDLVGPTARSATPQLVHALDDEDEAVRDAARRALLVGIGPRCVPHLRQILTWKHEPRLRLRSVEILTEMGGAETKDAWIALLRALAEDNEELHDPVCRAFQVYGADAVDFLYGWLTGKHVGMRCAAAEALSWIGEPARKTAPALEEGLAHRDPRVRKTFEETMRKLGLPVPSPLPTPRTEPQPPQ
ncbi:HEAT repeat domain-containing protein [Candidatus Sumerlaeota bacterium]|nr:HEAT repeat domain-containing protein [Candidatus Sumerlaeota bacterium]